AEERSRSIRLRRRWLDDKRRQHRLGGLALLGKYRFRRRAPRWITGKLLVSRAQQCGCAQAEDEYRRRQDDRGEQKAKAGQHREGEFRLGRLLRRPLSQRERGENGTGRVRGASSQAARSRIRLI